MTAFISEKLYAYWIVSYNTYSEQVVLERISAPFNAMEASELFLQEFDSSWK
jgi:hypothetical protein